jgi:hypothetical protein
MATGAKQTGNWRASAVLSDVKPELQSLPEEAEAPAESLAEMTPPEAAVTEPVAPVEEATSAAPPDYEPTIESIAGEMPSPPSFLRETLPAALFAVAALAWLLAIAWSIAFAGPATPLSLLELVSWIGLASGPIAVIGIFYLLLRRTSRREARRFARSATAMAGQAAYLEQVLSMLSSRVEEHHALLSRHAEQLLDQGDRAAERLAAISGSMREETSLLARHSARLGGVASAARGDMTAIMVDLPKAEEKTLAMTQLLQEASLAAHEQATVLESQVAALATRGSEADAMLSAAAQSLGGHLERIEATGQAAEQRMETAAAEMARTVDSALAQAALAIEETRKGMEAQSAAMLAMIEQGRAALNQAGADSARSLAQRLEEIGGKVDSLAARLAAQDAASHTLVGSLDAALTEIERRFAVLGETGAERTADLAEAIVKLSGHSEHMTEALGSGAVAADALLQRAGLLRAALDACAREVGEVLPTALGRLEGQAAQSQAALAATVPEAAKLEASASAAADRLAQADARMAALRQQTDDLNALIAETEANARQLTDAAGPQLVDALLRVRETAGQAADRARETLASIIPEAAAALGQASGEEMERALGGRVEQQMAELAAASQRAVEAAQTASERLMRQMLTIAETSSQVEARISEAKAEAEASDQESFSRRVALLIESLNSTAIDVTKILSNDVTDSAWAAYLRGDRGIFTRRAVRLIDSGEAREIARYYEEEAEFREQVNRYIHDFEAMLRRVLASRDGNPLGVTLLSSDMGKLYVALAQAIERLRK